ncbi:hypothetical protein J3R82DRAFT_11208 [Butyriboletus roseoflavus]|nr:hypothetical protein J3R82DRAFT_11208 [Butyriboletus roseoflavus]
MHPTLFIGPLVSDSVRQYLLDQGILNILIKQLRFKDSALLAAYALTKCLTHQIFSAPINEDMFLAGYIVNMIRLDYFDEAIGVTEGFTIFEDLLECGELRCKILEYDIAGLLEHKIGAGKPAEMRMSLIYLNIFRIHGHLMARNLVERGLSYLETNQWKTQKPGVAILCSLAQTWFSVEALKQVIPNVVNMLLPNYGPDSQRATNLPSSNQSKLPSSLLGPAFVLHIMAENETLREEIRQIPEYGRLKHLYLFGDLLGMKETPIWQVKTPTRDDVLDVINQMIKSVDSVEGSMNAGFILPHIQHLDRVGNVVRDSVVDAIVVPSVVAGVAALTVIGAITFAPVVASRKIAEWIGRPWRLRQQDAIIRSLRHPSSASQNAPKLMDIGLDAPFRTFGTDGQDEITLIDDSEHRDRVEDLVADADRYLADVILCFILERGALLGLFNIHGRRPSWTTNIVDHCLAKGGGA